MNLNQYWNEGEENEAAGLRNLCCGCGVCSQICPKDAISLEKNSMGFYYPVINEENCIHCGICVKKCQCLSDRIFISTKEEPEVYAAVHKDLHRLKDSSSGGAAFVLAEYILEQQGVAFGAVYNDAMDIVHKKIELKEDLWRLQGSKYAQSKIGKTYQQVEECLKNGRKVLFTGTPCQIGGLYHFLGRDYPELYTMDIICYGVASPGIFKDYITWKENKTNGKIIHINFRNKLDKWGSSITEILYSNRKSLYRYSDEDEWYQTFISHAATRESCHFCKYTNLQRMSDITVGDFWGIKKFKPDLECSRGISKVLLNTDKGKLLFESISNNITVDKMELKSAVRPNLLHPPSRNERREKFFEDYCALGFYFAFKNNVEEKVPLRRHLKRWLKIKIKSKVGK